MDESGCYVAGVLAMTRQLGEVDGRVAWIRAVAKSTGRKILRYSGAAGGGRWGTVGFLDTGTPCAYSGAIRVVKIDALPKEYHHAIWPVHDAAASAPPLVC